MVCSTMLSASRYACGLATVLGSSRPTSFATITLRSFNIASPDGERATTSAKAVVSACIAAFETILCRSTRSSTYRFVAKNIESPLAKASNMNAASSRGKPLTALGIASGARCNHTNSNHAKTTASATPAAIASISAALSDIGTFSAISPRRNHSNSQSVRSAAAAVCAIAPSVRRWPASSRREGASSPL